MKLPLLTQLHALQLHGYETSRYVSWAYRNIFTASLSNKKPLVKTTKISVLTITAALLCISTFIINPVLLLVSAAVFLLFPFPFIVLANVIVISIELAYLRYVQGEIRRIILNNNIEVIGITGSFGKTSTKHILYYILNFHTYSLTTPGSYNTILGIRQVLKKELTAKHKLFIAELGAYYPGDIAKLSNIVQPKHAILTAVGAQHLERFKTIDAIAKTKFELIDAVENKSNAIINIDSPKIKEKFSDYPDCKTFSLKDASANFLVSDYKFSKTGTTLTITHNSKSYDFKTPLFSTVNVYNAGIAISLAMLMGVPEKTISNALKVLPQIPHRFELRQFGKATVIDNAYSSNVSGFTSMVKDVHNLPGNKVIITPGIIELGKESEKVHVSLGNTLAKTFNAAYLVGNNERTKALQKGINTQTLVKNIENNWDIAKLLQELAQEYDWIVIENDVTDISA